MGPTLELHLKLGMIMFNPTFNRSYVAHGKDILMEVDVNDTIDKVRASALRQVSVSAAHGDLHFRGNALDPQRTVLDSGLSNGDRLYLFYSLPRGWE